MGSAMDALIARGLPAIDPAGDYYKIQSQQQEQALRRQQMQAAAQQMQMQQQMMPLKISEAQQQAQLNQMQLDAAQRQQQGEAAYTKIAQDPQSGGDAHKIHAAASAPGSGVDFDTWTRHDKVLAGLRQQELIGQENEQKIEATHNKHDASRAMGVANGGYLQQPYEGLIHGLVDEKRMTPDEATSYLQSAADPEARKAHVDQLIGLDTGVQDSWTKTQTGREAAKKAERESAAADVTGAIQEAPILDAQIQAQPDQKDALYQQYLAAHPAMAKKLPKVYPGLNLIRQMGITPEQQAKLEEQATESTRKAMPNTPTELAIWAADPKRTPEEKAQAATALATLERHAIASRPVTNIGALPTSTGPGAKLAGEDFLNTLPLVRQSMIRGMATGAIPPPSPNSRSAAAQQNLADLMQYDPGFSTQRAQVRKAFTTGTDAKNIGNINTAIVHLGRLSDTADALKNGTFTPGNELFNYFKDKFGSATTTNFGLLKDAVAGEMASALKGTATDLEISKMGQSIRAANSPEQMRGVVQEGMGILKDKANTYDERYHSLMPDDPWSPILPSAKATLGRFNVKPAGGGGAPAAGAGKITVQIPGQPPGQIPADQKEQFLKKHPNAKVL